MTPADIIYSLTLFLSLGAGAASLVLVLVGVLRKVKRIPPIARRLGWLGWGALLVSFAVHYTLGHAPGTPAALSPAAFVGEHVAFVVALLLPLPGVLGWGRRSGDS